MTDNRTTELREKLDALGIEHFDYDKGGRTQTMWESPEDMRNFTYETAANPAKTAKLIIEWFPTPEQAIAAALGSEREQALEKMVRDMWRTLSAMYQLNLGIDIGKEHDYEQRIAALGIEVINE